MVFEWGYRDFLEVDANQAEVSGRWSPGTIAVDRDRNGRRFMMYFTWMLAFLQRGRNVRYCACVGCSYFVTVDGVLEAVVLPHDQVEGGISSSVFLR